MMIIPDSKLNTYQAGSFGGGGGGQLFLAANTIRKVTFKKKINTESPPPLFREHVKFEVKRKK